MISSHSATGRRRIKQFTQLAKSLHPLMTRIPNPLPKPGTEAYWMSKKGDAKTDTKRKEQFTKDDQYRLDKSVIRYWLESPSFDEVRR